MPQALVVVKPVEDFEWKHKELQMLGHWAELKALEELNESSNIWKEWVGDGSFRLHGDIYDILIVQIYPKTVKSQ